MPRRLKDFEDRFFNASGIMRMIDPQCVRQEIIDAYPRAADDIERLEDVVRDLVAHRAEGTLKQAEAYLEPACIEALKALVEPLGTILPPSYFWQRFVLTENEIERAGRKRDRKRFRNEIIARTFECLGNGSIFANCAREDHGVTGYRSKIAYLSELYGIGEKAVEKAIQAGRRPKSSS